MGKMSLAVTDSMEVSEKLSLPLQMLGKIKQQLNFRHRIYSLHSSETLQPNEALASMSLPLLQSHALLLLKPTRKFISSSRIHSKNSYGRSPSHSCNGLTFVRNQKLLSDLSTWAIGGPCNYFVQVFDQTQLATAIRYCREYSLRFMIIGKRSNCLFDDMGYDL